MNPILDLQHPNKGIPYKQFLFKSGECSIKIERFAKEEVDIHFPYNNDGKLIGLLMATDALRRMRRGVKINLFIPYFPGGRQDRVMNWGEALSVKVYADLINSQNYNSVHIFDPHSEVTAALINNVVVHSNHIFVENCLRDSWTKMGLGVVQWPNNPNMLLVAPDSGANKKIYNLSKFLGGVEVIRADKLRDVRTGKIIETTVYADNLSGKVLYIADDICSGGRTFFELAKKLKEKGADKIFLIVSHYEGVADLNKMKESGIDGVYCTNSICEVLSDEYIKQVDVFSYIQ